MPYIDDILSEDLGANSSSSSYADGPFCVVHNGFMSIGRSLSQNDDDTIMLYDETEAFFIDNSYNVSVSEDGEYVLLRSDRYDSTFEIRPLTLDDNVWAYPEFEFLNLDHMKIFAREQMRRLNKPYGEDMAVLLGVTLDEDLSVLNLFRSDNTGVFLRSSGRWIAIDTDSEEDTDLLDGYEWMDVSGDFVRFFDENEDSEQLTIADVQFFVVK